MARSASPTRRIDVEALKAERPLVDVVASYGVALRRAGAETFRGLCPFHEERTPSFWIDARDPTGEHYYCFGCQGHGDVLTFVIERESCSFREACERLSARCGPQAVEPVRRAATTATGRHWEKLAADSVEAQVLDLALQVYEIELWRDTRAQAYLLQRAVPEDVARKQRLGYANGRALLTRIFDRKQNRDELLPVAVDLGLVLERPGAEDERPKYREFFVDRLIVPELRQGRPIWCIGRAVEDQDESAIESASSRDLSGSQWSTVRRRPKYLGLAGEKPIMGLEHVIGRRAA